MFELVELSPRFDGRKSFYGKAQVTKSNGIITLLSYGCRAARIVNGKLEKLSYWNYSATARRHCREFCRQFNVEDQI